MTRAARYLAAATLLALGGCVAPLDPTSATAQGLQCTTCGGDDDGDIGTGGGGGSDLPVCNYDGHCDSGEACDDCADCGACPPPPPPACGDHACNGDETCATCPGDCGSCPVQSSYEWSLDEVVISTTRAGFTDTDYVVLGVSYPNHPYSGPDDYTTVSHAVFLGDFGDGMHIFDPALMVSGYDNRYDTTLNTNHGSVTANHLYEDMSTCADQAGVCWLGSEYDDCATSGGRRSAEAAGVAFKAWNTSTPVYLSMLMVNSGHSDPSSSSLTRAKTWVKRCHLEPFITQRIDPTSPPDVSFFGPSSLNFATYYPSYPLQSLGGFPSVQSYGSIVSGIVSLLQTFDPNLLSSDCDGVVASYMLPTTGTEIASRLSSDGAHQWQQSITHPGYDSPWGCGSNSFYQTATAIRPYDSFVQWLSP